MKRWTRWAGLLALGMVGGAAAGTISVGDLPQGGSAPLAPQEPAPMGFDLGPAASEPDPFAPVDLEPRNPVPDLLGGAPAAAPGDLWADPAWGEPMNPLTPDPVDVTGGYDFSTVTDFSDPGRGLGAAQPPAWLQDLPPRPAGMSSAAWMHQLSQRERDYTGLPVPHDRMVEAPYTMEDRQAWNREFDATRPFYERWAAKGAGKLMGWVALDPLHHGDVIDVMQENQHDLNRIYDWMEDNPGYQLTPEEAAGVLARQQYVDQMRGEYGQLWKEAGIKVVASAAGGPIVGKLAKWAKPVVTGTVTRDVLKKTLPKVGGRVRDGASRYAPRTVETLSDWGRRAGDSYQAWMPRAGKWAVKKEATEELGYAVDAALGERPTLEQLATQGLGLADAP